MQQRSESERNLPLWQIQVLDEARRKEALNIIENPAIWAKLIEIEAKLDMICAAIKSMQNPHSIVPPTQTVNYGPFDPEKM